MERLTTQLAFLLAAAGLIGALSGCAATEQDLCADIEAKLQSCQPDRDVAVTCDDAVLNRYAAIIEGPCPGSMGKADELLPLPERPDVVYVYPDSEPVEPAILDEFRVSVQSMSCDELDALYSALLDQALYSATQADYDYFMEFMYVVYAEMLYQDCPSTRL